jgi:predicted nucleic acid-binding protein
MGAVIPVFNNEILQEYEDVLNRRKFRFKSDVVKILISQIETLGISQDALKVNNDFPDQDNAVFFEVAMGVKQNHENSFLVTGNIKHFPKDPIVVTPAQFICIIEMLSGEHHPSV